MSRPTMFLTISPSVVSFTPETVTVLPSRSTITLSAIWKISFSRWEM